MLNVLDKYPDMKSFRLSYIANELLRKIGLAKLYYWFNK